MNDSDKERLSQIGAIMDSIGITTAKLAEKLKEHVVGCPGGKGCIEKLINESEK